MTLPWRSLRIRICFPVVIFISVIQVSCGIGQEINWYPDLNSATRAAAAQNKLILLHFTADWCRPCKTLESFVFSNPAVQRSFASNVIAVKIDVEENPDLVQQYAVSKVPYDVALTTSGRVVSKRQSPLESSGYNKMLAGYETIISSLASGKNPGAEQNLDELKKLIRNESPRFEGQTTSFIPDSPKHQAPVPSRESADLNRKSKVVNNPFAKTPPSGPKHVANAFHESQKSKSLLGSKSIAVTPDFIPDRVAAVDRNQFAPASPGNLVMPVLEKTTEADAGPSKVSPVNSSSKRVTNQFTAQRVRDESVVDKQQFAPPAEVGGNRDSEFQAPQRMARTPGKSSNSFVGSDTDKTKEVIPVPQVVLDKMIDASPLQIPGDYQTKTPLGDSHGFRPKLGPAGETVSGTPIVSDDEAPESMDAATDNSFQAPKSIPAPSFMASAIATPAVEPESSSFEKSQAVEKPQKTQKPQLALQGKCPVTLLTESRWIDGDPRWGCIHRSRTYIFASDAHLKRFQSDPDGFSPILAGFDPVVFHETGALADGIEEHGVFMGKKDHQRVVLFSAPETRAKFQRDPKKYLNTVRQAMQTSGDASSLMR